MRLSPASKKSLLIALSLVTAGVLARATLIQVSPLQAQAAVFPSLSGALSQIKSSVSKAVGNPAEVARHARGICIKGEGVPHGNIPGKSIPYPTCNSGLSKVGGILIPDCDLPGGCAVPTGCLNLICASFKSALWSPGDPSRHLPPTCACGEPDVVGGAKSFLSKFIPLPI